MKRLKNSIIDSLSLKSFLFKKSTASLIINLIGMVMAFLLQIVLTNALGAKNYGVYNFILTIIAFIVLFIKMGLDSVLIRYVAAYDQQNQMEKLKGLIIRSNQLILLNSFIVWTLVFINFRFSIFNIDDKLIIGLAIATISIPFISLTAIRQSILQGFRKIEVSQLPEKILNPLMIIIVTFTITFFFEGNISSQVSLIIYVCVCVVTFIIGNYFLRDIYNKKLKNITPIFMTKDWAYTAFPLMLVSGMYLILGQVDIIMLGTIKDTTESGIYSICVKIATLISFGINAVNITARPLISQAYVSKDYEEMKNITRNSAYFGSIIAFSVFFIILIFQVPILSIFGEEFIQGKLALIILSASFVVNASFGQTGSIMMMTGQQKSLSLVLLGASIINIILNLWLIPPYGIIGAATATFISTLIWNLTTLFLVIKVHNINSSIFQRRNR